MDARLLARAYADHLAVPGVTHRVALGVFQRDRGHYQIPDGRLGQVFVVGDDVGKERGVDDGVVTLLFERQAEQDFAFYGVGDVVRVDLGVEKVNFEVTCICFTHLVTFSFFTFTFQK